MKLLVVNNHSIHLEELLNNLEEIEVVNFEKLSEINYQDYDGIILSGGSSFSVVDHEKEYSPELDLIKNCEKPILGICLGFELINFAFGEKIELLKNKRKGKILIKLISQDNLFNSFSKSFQVYESHRWVVLKNKFLKSLAESKDGIEAVKHFKKKIYGVQFHQEVFINKNHSEKIIKNFLKIIKDSL